MKIFIIAALTADGFVAKDATHLAREWTTYEDKRLFTWLTKWAKVIVVGNNTYKTFDRPFPDRRLVVYSRTRGKAAEGVEFTNESPDELLDRLEAEGVKGVAICGGVQIYDLFMATGRVKEFYLSVQPRLFGQGLTLFSTPMDKQLRLTEAQVSTAENMVILHYLEDESSN